MRECSLWVRHKQDYGRGFIFLLPQTVVLPGSNAGSDDVEQALGFDPKSSDLVLYVVPDVWGTLLGRGLQLVKKRHTRNLMKEQDSVCAWTYESAQLQSVGNLASQAVGASSI